MNRKIPKIIHYVWIGGKPKSEKIEKYINTWKVNLPDFKICEWNESKFDINVMNYTKEAYLNKKYAYVSDVIRLYALYKFGGIYFDTDIEVIDSFDKILSYDSFLGFESESRLSTAVIGATAGSKWVEEIYKEYKKEHFLDNNNKPILKTNVDRITTYFVNNKKLKLTGKRQKLDDNIMIFEQDIFSPIDMETGKINRTKNTLAIHRFDGSWVPIRSKFNKKIYRMFRLLMKFFRK